MNRRSVLLLFAALPALIGSLLLMSFLDVARGPIVQQAVVAIVGAAWLLMPIRLQDSKSPSSPRLWPVVAMAVLLFAPLAFGGAGSPHRWLVLGGIRLYLAPVVIPLFLLTWHLAAKDKSASQLASAAAMVLVGLALMLQPDASQLTAFALAALALLVGSGLSRALKCAVMAGLLVLAVVSWQMPDPLLPVLHVEGVFQLARQVSLLALVASIMAAALPVIALVWLSFTRRSAGLLAVAVYYATLFALAPLQLTPVPLLGFGAGPVLGYFLATRLASAGQRSS